MRKNPEHFSRWVGNEVSFLRKLESRDCHSRSSGNPVPLSPGGRGGPAVQAGRVRESKRLSPGRREAVGTEGSAGCGGPNASPLAVKRPANRRLAG